MTTVFVVTHGDKFSGDEFPRANPGMTPEGFEQVAALRCLLPKNPPAVVCGTGKRHMDVASALELVPTRFTSAVGGPDSLEMVGGERLIVLADGSTCQPNEYTTLEDTAPAAEAMIADLPDQSVLCVGRPSMIMLGKPNAKSAAVYAIQCQDDEIHGIVEVVATGQSETGTV